MRSSSRAPEALLLQLRSLSKSLLAFPPRSSTQRPFVVHIPSLGVADNLVSCQTCSRSAGTGLNSLLLCCKPALLSSSGLELLNLVALQQSLSLNLCSAGVASPQPAAHGLDCLNSRYKSTAGHIACFERQNSGLGYWEFKSGSQTEFPLSGATHGLSGTVGGVKASTGGRAPCGLRHGSAANRGRMHMHGLGGMIEGGLRGAGARRLRRGGCPGSLAVAQPASAHSGASSAVRSQASPCAAAGQGEQRRLKMPGF